jgi:hypothetical protein
LFVCLTPASLCSSIESGFLYGAQVAELSAESVFCANFLLVSRSAVRELAATLFVCLSNYLCKVASYLVPNSAVRVFASRFSVGSCVVRVVSSPKWLCPVLLL